MLHLIKKRKKKREKKGRRKTGDQKACAYLRVTLLSGLSCFPFSHSLCPTLYKGQSPYNLPGGSSGYKIVI